MNRRHFLLYSAALGASYTSLFGTSNDEEYGTGILTNKNISINSNDIFKNTILVDSVYNKLGLVNKMYGNKNFNIISFDETLKFMKDNSSKIKPFTNEEMSFIQQIFYIDPSQYGFYGKKTVFSLTQKINKDNIISIPYTGHYLYKSRSTDYYAKIKDIAGPDAIMTSGIRYPMKQMYLFLGKLKQVDYNMRVAMNSIAPPAHSYHSIGDFDIGQIGFGNNNFTPLFEQTDVFVSLKEKGVLRIRYSLNNADGVRYEPWHVRVV
jgi:hypothetical protein